MYIFNKLGSHNFFKKIIYFIFIVVVLIFISAYFYKQYQDAKLNHNGKIILGVITEYVYAPKSKRRIICNYKVNGKEYHKSGIVNYYEAKMGITLHKGDSVFITYYPPDPSISRIELDK